MAAEVSCGYQRKLHDASNRRHCYGLAVTDPPSPCIRHADLCIGAAQKVELPKSCMR